MGKKGKERREKKRRQRAKGGVLSGGDGGQQPEGRARPHMGQNKLLAPIHVDRGGNRHAPPLETLGFPESAAPTVAEIRARVAELIAGLPPGSDPERTRMILEARRWLIDDQMALERHFGVLRLPDPAKAIEGYEPRELDETNVAPRAAPPAWSTQSRLSLLMGLYALVEREIEGDAHDEPSPEGDGNAEGQLELF